MLKEEFLRLGSFDFIMNTPALPDCVRKTTWEPISFQYLVDYAEIDTDGKLPFHDLGCENRLNQRKLYSFSVERWAQKTLTNGARIYFISWACVNTSRLTKRTYEMSVDMKGEDLKWYSPFLFLVGAILSVSGAYFCSVAMFGVFNIVFPRPCPIYSFIFKTGTENCPLCIASIFSSLRETWSFSVLSQELVLGR